MEEYRKIWERAPQIVEEDYKFSEEIWKNYYATYRILNNTFRSVAGYYASADDDDDDNEEEEEEEEKNTPKKPPSLRERCAEYITKIKWEDKSETRYLFAMYPDPVCPHTSSLNAVEQEVYWFLRHKFSSSNVRAIVTEEENSLFSTLHQKVMEEQPVYCKYVESLWTAQKKRCLCLKPEIKKFVDEVWKNRISAAENYPPKYCNYKMIPLVFSGDSKRVRALPAPDETTTLGIPSRYTPPQPGQPLRICMENSKMEESFPQEKFKSKVPVSRDKTAKEIASSCRADVVISMSGLKCIMDNFQPDYDREWDIPIVVRDENLSVEGKTTKRVVYIDKLLPPRSMTAVDKNNWYNKYGIRALFCHLRNQELHRLIVPLSQDIVGKDSQTPDKKRGECESDGSSLNDSSYQSSDDDSKCVSDSSTEKLVIACSDDEAMKNEKTKQQSKIWGVPKKKKARRRQSKVHSKQNENKSDNSTKSPKTQQNGNSGETNGEQCESVRSTLEECVDQPSLMSNVCVNYRLWKLMLEKDSQEATRASFLKSESNYKPIVILIRNKQVAVKIHNGDSSPVYLAAKQEFQAEYGMSIPSMSDVCRLWTSLYFRMNCTLVRARIEAVSNAVLLAEEKNIDEIAQEWPDTRIRITLLSILYSVLLGLQGLEPGNYILSHRKKMGPFASLMKTTNRLSALDLSRLYEHVSFEHPEPTKDYPWSPIDCNLPTPSQNRRRRVPGLFPIVTAVDRRKRVPQFVAKKVGKGSPKMQDIKKKKNNKKNKKNNKKKNKNKKKAPVPFERRLLM